MRVSQPRPRPSTSTSCARRCAGSGGGRWWCSRPSPCSGPRRRARRSTSSPPGRSRRWSTTPPASGRTSRAGRSTTACAGCCCARARWRSTMARVTARGEAPGVAASAECVAGSSSSTPGPRASPHARPLPGRRRGGVGPGGAREHGRVELRPRPPAPVLRRDATRSTREPGGVGQPGRRERRHLHEQRLRARRPPRPSVLPGALGRRRPRIAGARSAQRDADDVLELGDGVVGVATLMVIMPRARAGFRLTPRSSRKTARCGSMPSCSQAIR